MEYKGQIKGFPQEIVDKMLEYQQTQGNKKDITVFEQEKCAGIDEKGFSWFNSEEGDMFWDSVIQRKKFHVFFKRYPKTSIIKPIEENFFDKAYTSICRMQKEKDKRYGNAALKPLSIFAKHHEYGARLDEKLARIKNGEVLRKNDVADIIGGLMLICKDRGWDNFDDLID